MSPAPLDPLAVIDSLDPDAIRQQLADLDRQRRALACLLRSVARRKCQPPGHKAPKEASHAD
jgi:hypothetical protein